MLITFSKYHGTGNDFVMVDNRSGGLNPTVDLVEKLCNRHFGIGADGLILLENAKESALMMRYFNSDGRESTMCGNGGRCFAHFAHQLGLAGQHVLFNGIDGFHEAYLLDNGNIRLRMIDVPVVESAEEGFFLNTGSPHFVVFVRSVENVNVDLEGRLASKSVNVKNGGTNVNFIQPVGEKVLKIRTYERGVEAETFSCGTGSVASAIAYADFFAISEGPVELLAPGGTLRVYFSHEGDGYKNIWLEGAVSHVFNGSIEVNDL